MNKDYILKVLQEVNKKVPAQLRKRVVVETPISPTIKMVAEKALAEADMTDEKRTALKDMLDKGVFDKSKYTVNEKIAKQIDNFVNREVNRLIKQGRLPPLNKIKEILNEKTQNS